MFEHELRCVLHDQQSKELVLLLYQRCVAPQVVARRRVHSRLKRARSRQLFVRPRGRLFRVEARERVHHARALPQVLDEVSLARVRVALESLSVPDVALV